MEKRGGKEKRRSRNTGSEGGRVGGEKEGLREVEKRRGKRVKRKRERERESKIPCILCTV